MNSYDIEVNLVPVDETDPSKGGKLELGTVPTIYLWDKGSKKVENAFVTWTFKNLLPGMEPTVSVTSTDVTVSGPHATAGATPKIKYRFQFPPTAPATRMSYPADHVLSVTVPGLVSDPISLTPPDLVIDRTPDPPGNQPCPSPRDPDHRRPTRRWNSGSSYRDA